MEAYAGRTRKLLRLAPVAMSTHGLDRRSTLLLTLPTLLSMSMVAMALLLSTILLTHHAVLLPVQADEMFDLSAFTEGGASQKRPSAQDATVHAVATPPQQSKQPKQAADPRALNERHPAGTHPRADGVGSGAPPPHAPEAEGPVPMAQIVIVSPKEGEVVTPSFSVRVEVTFRDDAAQDELVGTAGICFTTHLSAGKGGPPYACHKLLSTFSAPISYAGVSPGAKRLVAVMTDASSGAELTNTRTAVRSFRVETEVSHEYH